MSLIASAAIAATQMANQAATSALNNKTAARLEDMQGTEFQSQDFADRNKNVIADLQKRAGIKGESSNAIGALINNRKMKRVEDEYEQIGENLQGSENRTIGAQLSNSMPSYQSPSYGRNGGRLGQSFAPRTRYSINTRNI